MKTKNILFIAGTMFFVQCSNPNLNENAVSDKTSEKDSCCVKNNSSKDSIGEVHISKNSMQSEITCPKCGFKKMEIMPTDVCRLKYTCEKCNTDLFPKEGDCCVFCTYGDKKCPSKQ